MHISAKQTHGCDQDDDQRIHCFYLFPFFPPGKCQRHELSFSGTATFPVQRRKKAPVLTGRSGDPDQTIEDEGFAHTWHIMYGTALRVTTSFAALAAALMGVCAQHKPTAR